LLSVHALSPYSLFCGTARLLPQAALVADVTVGPLADAAVVLTYFVKKVSNV
jgi:hypothetical protein